jgi:hypothetical protein
LKAALKFPPRRPKWFIAKGMKRLVPLFWIGPTDLASFLNFSFYAFMIAKSEL